MKTQDEDPEQLGFSFFLEEPYIQAIKQAIAWEEGDPLKAEMAKNPERALLQFVCTSYIHFNQMEHHLNLHLWCMW